jgi:S1-C subfamily serine protease
MWLRATLGVLMAAWPLMSRAESDRGNDPVPSIGLSSQKNQPMSSEARARARRAISAVGLIFVRNAYEQAPRLRASAVVISKEGIVATNYHVVAQDKVDRVYDEIYFTIPSAAVAPSDWQKHRLKLVLVSKAYDLALLRVVSTDPGQFASVDWPAIELGDSRHLQLLDDLIVIGFPEKGGTSVTVNPGVVEGIDTVDSWIKTDARLLLGNSGGAAVNSDGKLIGIPTKVILDTETKDRNRDGEVRALGGIGFLRPAHLLVPMLAQLSEGYDKDAAPKITDRSDTGLAEPKSDVVERARPKDSTGQVGLILRGVVKSASDGKPIGGARVGLIPVGSANVTAANLLTWGGTNPDGRFEMNKQVPAGKYTLKAVAFGYVSSTRDVEVGKPGSELIVELRPNP